MNAIFFGAAILIGAPALKETPKKETGIVGEWIPESIGIAGKLGKAPSSILRYEFTSDGKWIIRRDGVEAKSPARDYKVDAKASPATIDVGSVTPAAAAPARPMLGIYKIEEDTLTICFAAGGGDRPTSFDPNDGARTMVMILKRAKK